jgi:hypothetical protein
MMRSAGETGLGEVNHAHANKFRQIFRIIQEDEHAVGAPPNPPLTFLPAPLSWTRQGEMGSETEIKGGGKREGILPNGRPGRCRSGSEGIASHGGLVIGLGGKVVGLRFDPGDPRVGDGLFVDIQDDQIDVAGVEGDAAQL